MEQQTPSIPSQTVSTRVQPLNMVFKARAWQILVFQDKAELVIE